MKFDGTHASSRFAPGRVTVTNSKAIMIYGEMRKAMLELDKVIERRQVAAIKKVWNMELLTSESRYGQGRGRSAVASTFVEDNMLLATDSETVEDAIDRLIELDSPFLSAIRGEDWNGTIAGVKTLIGEIAALHSTEDRELVASYRTVEKENANRKNVIKFTFRVKA